MSEGHINEGPLLEGDDDEGEENEQEHPGVQLQLTAEDEAAVNRVGLYKSAYRTWI